MKLVSVLWEVFISYPTLMLLAGFMKLLGVFCMNIIEYSQPIKLLS